MQVQIYGRYLGRSEKSLSVMQETDRGDRLLELFCPVERKLPEGLEMGSFIIVHGVVLQKKRDEGGYRKYFCLVDTVVFA